MSFAEVQKIIGAHEETTRRNDGPGVQGVCVLKMNVGEETEKV